MKKKVLLLFPYRFTEFNYYKFEISKLEKKFNVKVIIHDLSNIVSNKKLNKEWKTKLEKKTLKFSSLISWISCFNKIEKKKVIIFNFLETSNINSFIINLLVRLSELPVMFYSPVSPFSSIKPFKKNINFFLTRFKQHGLNLKIYFFPIKILFFRFLINFKKFNKVFLLSNNFKKKSYTFSHYVKAKNFFKIDFNFYDYSNALLVKKNKKKIKKKYIIYIDNGAPYFTGDANLKGDILAKFNVKKDYRDLNLFFDKIEKYFKAKVIVIPHPKYKSSNTKKIKSLNPYFNSRIVNNDYDSLAKLTPNCLFIINKMSTALSYAIFHNKPAIHIYSSEYFHAREELQSILDQSKNVGHKPIDICNFNKKKIIKSLAIKNSKYKYYRYQYLTPENKTVEKIPNYKIIGDLIQKNI